MASSMNSRPVLPSSEYIYLFLSSNEIVEQLQQLAEQSVSTYPSIKSSDIGSRKILVPSFEDGKRLQCVLAPLFDEISANSEDSLYLAELRDTLLPRLMSGDVVTGS